MSDTTQGGPLTPGQWLDLILDPGEREWLDEDLVREGSTAADVARLEKARAATGHNESLVTVRGRVGGRPVICAVLDFAFLGGTLGSASGERLVRALERGRSAAGFVLVTATGGTRVQEGLDSFLQMTRVMAARARLAEARRPLIVIAADPTMGGVAASVVAAADVLFAVTGARLGLSGDRAAAAMGHEARVDTSEQALEAGLVDAVLAPDQVRDAVQRALDALAPGA